MTSPRCSGLEEPALFRWGPTREAGLGADAKSNKVPIVYSFCSEPASMGAGMGQTGDALLLKIQLGVPQG